LHAQAADLLIDDKTSAEVCSLLAEALIDQEAGCFATAEEGRATHLVMAANNTDEVSTVRSL
jgi:hypothetical protein